MERCIELFELGAIPKAGLQRSIGVTLEFVFVGDVPNVRCDGGRRKRCQK